MKNYFKVFIILCVFVFAIYSFLKKDHQVIDAKYIEETIAPIYKYGIVHPKRSQMSQNTIELDEFVTLYSGYLSKQLNESMQEAWKEELWIENKKEYTQQKAKEGRETSQPSKFAAVG